MAKVERTRRWAKKQLFYSFREKRDFGRANGLDQAGIESKFQKACDEWGAQAGLTFTKQEAENPHIIVSWRNFGSKVAGADTDFTDHGPYFALISFNDDIWWTADKNHKNYADFFFSSPS
jgi:hypothetical protein